MKEALKIILPRLLILLGIVVSVWVIVELTK